MHILSDVISTQPASLGRWNGGSGGWSNPYGQISPLIGLGGHPFQKMSLPTQDMEDLLGVEDILRW